MVEKKKDKEETIEVGNEKDYDREITVVKDGIVKQSDFPKITKAFLNYVFPDGAISSTYSSSMQKNIKGYHGQYILNALNEVIGMNCWREYGEMETYVPVGKTAFISIYTGTFEIGNWKNKFTTKTVNSYDENGVITKSEIVEENLPYFEVLAQFKTYGGSRNIDKWESLKGAKTNFLKKVCSYISNGWKSYALDLDDDFKNQSVKDDGKEAKPVAKKQVEKAEKQVEAKSEVAVFKGELTKLGVSNADEANKVLSKLTEGKQTDITKVVVDNALLLKTQKLTKDIVKEILEAK